MPIEVEGPDGQVHTFPSGTPTAQINRVLEQKYAGPQSGGLIGQGAPQQPQQPQAPPQAAPQGGLLGGKPIGAPPQGQVPRMIDALPILHMIKPDLAKGLLEHPAYKQALKAAEVNQRAAMAQQFGMSPQSPEGKEYILSGSIPKFERNYPAIQKADDTVLQTQQSIDKANEALDLNKNSISMGPLTSPLATIAGWWGNKSAMDTQQYQVIAKGLSQEIAKALGGSRPTAFEQKLQADLQGGLSQPREVREAIIKDTLKHLQAKNAFAQRQADEMRNGTYYQARQPQAAPQQAAAPDLSKMSTDDILKALGNGR